MGGCCRRAWAPRPACSCRMWKQMCGPPAQWPTSPSSPPSALFALLLSQRDPALRCCTPLLWVCRGSGRRAQHHLGSAMLMGCSACEPGPWAASCRPSPWSREAWRCNCVDLLARWTGVCAAHLGCADTWKLVVLPRGIRSLAAQPEVVPKGSFSGSGVESPAPPRTRKLCSSVDTEAMYGTGG